MSKTGIIGGTGLTSLEGLAITRKEVVQTPYGDPSGPLVIGSFCGNVFVFLARHGFGHTIPPHRVNYRANVWALHHAEVDQVIAVAAVGAINAAMVPGQLVFPDQIIDYTWSRAHTFVEVSLDNIVHIDFTRPYCQKLRDTLIAAASSADIDTINAATYGATQGPRLETAAEINRLDRDGCDVVGMTGMPEAALARELDLCYATCAVVANLAAGRTDEPLTMAMIDANLKIGMERVRSLLEHTIALL